MASLLSREDCELLEIMRQQNSVAGKPFTPSSVIWQACCNVLYESLHNEGFGVVEQQCYNNHFSARPAGHKCYDVYVQHMQCRISEGEKVDNDLVTSTNDLKNYELACKLLYAFVKARDEAGILNKSSCTSANTISIDGRLLSWDYLMSVASIQAINKQIPDLLTKQMVVVDLGAGWGRIGHLLMQLNQNLTYIILDLPESLLISRHRLRELFPAKNVLDYETFFNKNDVITKASLLALPSIGFGGSHHIKNFAPDSIDLLININSFQEMDPDDHELYLNIFDSRVNKFYLMAHESPLFSGQLGKKFKNYHWPKHWKLLHHVSASSLFFYSDFFETIFECKTT